jgi:hypothetical protein
MAHIFKNFLRTDWKSIKTVPLVLEKSTKKAIIEIMERMNSILESEDFIIVKLDATILKEIDKIALIVGYCISINRNIDSFKFRAVQIQLSQSRSDDIDDEHLKLFMKLRNKGGNPSDYAAQQGCNWYIINAILIKQVEEMLSKLCSIQDKYEPHIKMLAEKLPRLEDRIRRWDFHTKQYDIFTLYKRCFNEVDQILAPASCYNPNPSFQRELVWSLDKKKRFICSILDELPIGSFYVNYAKEYDPYFKLGEGFGGLVWDGKQRLHALHDFISGKFSVLVNGVETYYHDDPGYFMLSFNSCSITIYESNFETLREIIEAYVIINSAQVKHTDEDLKKAIDYLSQQGELS